MNQTTLLLPRLATILLMPIELAIVGWYFAYWDTFPKYSARRLIPWLVFMTSSIAIPLLQISVYKMITFTAKVEDPFVSVSIFTESLMSAAIAFYFLAKRRSRNDR
jgi:hypothetical protein